MADYNQYESSPNGLNFLAGDINPWDDYVIFRQDDYTSVAIYGNCIDTDPITFKTCTIRKLIRNSQSGYSTYYRTTETDAKNITVSITEPYYAYGNIIGVDYALPRADNVSSVAVCGAVVVMVLLSVFRTLFSLKRVKR